MLNFVNLFFKKVAQENGQVLDYKCNAQTQRKKENKNLNNFSGNIIFPNKKSYIPIIYAKFIEFIPIVMCFRFFMGPSAFKK